MILKVTRLLHVSQGEEHPAEEQRVRAVQQPERAAHRSEAPHPLHGGPRQRGQHGQRLLGRPELLPPSAAVQRTQRGYKHIPHHAGQATGLQLHTRFIYLFYFLLNEFAD